MLTLLLLGWLARASRFLRAAPYIVAYAPQESSRPLHPRDAGVLVET